MFSWELVSQSLPDFFDNMYVGVGGGSFRNCSFSVHYLVPIQYRGLWVVVHTLDKNSKLDSCPDPVSWAWVWYIGTRYF